MEPKVNVWEWAAVTVILGILAMYMIVMPSYHTKVKKRVDRLERCMGMKKHKEQQDCFKSAVHR